MAQIDRLLWGDTPTFGTPLLSWPIFGLVGNHFYSDSAPSIDDYEPDIRPQLRLKREDDEILLILSAIIKEL